MCLIRLPEHGDCVNDKLWAKSETFGGVAGNIAARTNNSITACTNFANFIPCSSFDSYFVFLLNEVYRNPWKLSMLYILLFRNTVLSTDPPDTPCSPKGTIKLV